jgi:hypothetical protein
MSRTHTVQNGDGLDSLWKISKAYGVSFQEVKKLNSVFKGRQPPYWINPGDVVKLPTCMETGQLKKAAQHCPQRRKIVAVDGPTPFEICQPAEFRVSQYDGAETTWEAYRSVLWFVRDAVTKEDLLRTVSATMPDMGKILEIDCVPFSWYGRTVEAGAQFIDAEAADLNPIKTMFSGKPNACELYRWIATIQKAEAAYPALSGVQMTNAMRRIATYDNSYFR